MTTQPADPHTRLRPTLPTPSMVTLLQAIESYPAVTLLMSTTPASRMLPEDSERLRGMPGEAEVRLTSEALPGIRGTILRPLAELAEEAGHGPATEAIAIFVSAATHDVVHLNVLVADRVVVDPTFATRDLVRALHRTPRHVVLTLSQREARLFERVGGNLHPAPGRSFPRLAAGAEAAQRGEHEVRVQRRRSFYRTVDRALGAYLRVHPAPLVLVGAGPRPRRPDVAHKIIHRSVTGSDGLTMLAGGPCATPRRPSRLSSRRSSRGRETIGTRSQRSCPTPARRRPGEPVDLEEVAGRHTPMPHDVRHRDSLAHGVGRSVRDSRRWVSWGRTGVAAPDTRGRSVAGRFVR